MLTIPSLSLYIHIPWCVRKCPYCDFNSHEIRDDLSESAYVTALIKDLEQDLPKISGRTVNSIFLGGGTPSIFAPETMATLLTEVRARLTVRSDAEITLEANPGTVDSLRFQGFRQAGVNRLSIGVQSFDETALQRLGRIHTQKQAVDAIIAAKQAGFKNINVDLMFGLPLQTLETALQDLQTAVTLQPQHLSWYQLTIEPNTAFYQRPPPLPTDEILWEMQTMGQTYLAEQGYMQYEISAYAQSGWRCQHNLNYWQFGDYLGIGAGAHGKITDNLTHTIVRFSKQRHPKAYLETAGTSANIASYTVLNETEKGLEFMMNALRLHEGFTIAQLTNTTGLNIEQLATPLQQALQRKWLVQQIDRICTTAIGRQFLNDLLELFVP